MYYAQYCYYAYYAEYHGERAKIAVAENYQQYARGDYAYGHGVAGYAEHSEYEAAYGLAKYAYGIKIHTRA